MSFSAVAFWLCLIGGALALWIGTYKPRNRRRKGVLKAPSPACKRNSTEAVGP